MEDLNLCGRLSTVCIRIVRCYEPLEVHYYALGHELCIYCCSADNLTGCYPQCPDCSSKLPVKKRT